MIHDFSKLTARDLREWRREQEPRMSRRQLSRILGLHLSTLYRWEHGITKIPKWLGIVLAGLETGVLEWEEFENYL